MKLYRVSFLVLILMSGFLVMGQHIPELEDASRWSPMAGTTPAAAVEFSGRKAVRMPCNFAGMTDGRAAWDSDISLDLSTARGVSFQFYCADPGPVSSFVCHLRSGGGWYSVSFSSGGAAAWETISISKLASGMEGKPGGWARIDRVRISAWRGGNTDTEFFVSGFQVIPGGKEVVILREESGQVSGANNMRTVCDVGERVGGLLDNFGVPFTPLSDLDVLQKILANAKVVLLPYNPAMRDETVNALISFIKGGGKVVSFYLLPERLAAALGLKQGKHVPQTRPGGLASIRASETPLPGQPNSVTQASWNAIEMFPVANGRVAAYWHDDNGQNTGVPAVVVTERAAHMTHIVLADDPGSKGRLVLSMLGNFAPALWKSAAEHRLDHAGAFGVYADFAQVCAAVADKAGSDLAREALRQAEAAHARCGELLEAEKYAEAVEASADVDAAMLRAWCAAQQPATGEFRGFWCHDAFGVQGMTWDEAVRILAENGFTAVFPNMLWGGVAYYPSAYLPVAVEIGERGDQVAACIAACKKYGVQCHVWKVNWNTGGRAPADFLARMKAEGRTQVRFDGTAEDGWLCPSHPANQQLESDAMLEVATKYDVDGIHFDYIRYPDRTMCYCAGCRERFAASVAEKAEPWPGAVGDGGPLRDKWLEFRRGQITRVVAAVSEGVRKVKPGIKVSAAVFPNPPVDRDAIGQDWPLWCAKGYVDFVCPMDYTEHSGAFARQVAQQRAWAGKVPYYPGIGLSVWLDGDIARFIDHVTITREQKTGGFMVFNYGLREARDVAPLCGLGLTRR